VTNVHTASLNVLTSHQLPTTRIP